MGRQETGHLMRYANELLIAWYMLLCSYIVVTNPGAHVEFILMNAGVFALYKFMQDRENGIRTKG